MFTHRIGTDFLIAYPPGLSAHGETTGLWDFYFQETNGFNMSWMGNSNQNDIEEETGLFEHLKTGSYQHKVIIKYKDDISDIITWISLCTFCHWNLTTDDKNESFVFSFEDSMYAVLFKLRWHSSPS